eukprot:14593672-Ditylum_brightwellii.AAC.1
MYKRLVRCHQRRIQGWANRRCSPPISALSIPAAPHRSSPKWTVAASALGVLGAASLAAVKSSIDDDST